MLNFVEWIKKMGGGAGIPYDPSIDVTKSAQGWWGAPESMLRPKPKRKRKKKKRK